MNASRTSFPRRRESIAPSLGPRAMGSRLRGNDVGAAVDCRLRGNDVGAAIASRPRGNDAGAA